MPVTVLFADDHRLMVQGFKSTLTDFGIDVVDVSYTLDGLAQRFADVSPDVLVIDVRFTNSDGQLSGLDVAEAILARNPAAKIVVFSQFDDEYIIERAYRLGILAFVKKDENVDVLVAAIESASKGKEFFSPTVAQQLAWLSIKAPMPTRLLDDKELRVFKLIADGASQSEVAQELDVSIKTVGTIVKNVRHKLGINNAADFTKLAIKYGLTTLELRTKN